MSGKKKVRLKKKAVAVTAAIVIAIVSGIVVIVKATSGKSEPVQSAAVGISNAGTVAGKQSQNKAAGQPGTAADGTIIATTGAGSDGTTTQNGGSQSGTLQGKNGQNVNSQSGDSQTGVNQTGYDQAEGTGSQGSQTGTDQTAANQTDGQGQSNENTSQPADQNTNQNTSQNNGQTTTDNSANINPTGGNDGYDSSDVGSTLTQKGFNQTPGMANVYTYEENGTYCGEIVTQSDATIIYINRRSQEFDSKVQSVIASMIPDSSTQVWNAYVSAVTDKTMVADNKKVRIVTASDGGHSQIIIYN